MKTQTRPTPTPRRRALAHRAGAWLPASLCALACACTAEDPPAPASDAPEPPACTPDQERGPRAREVDGLLAVPIDIETLDAKVTLDAGARTATAEATLRFVMGPRDGHPAFDLRQPITEAILNGQPLDPAELAHHDLGGGEGSEVRVIAAELPACSENTLVLRYPLLRPTSAASRPIAYDPEAGRVWWDFWLSDLYAGRYLEMWFPANWIHDRLAMTLDLELAGADAPHRIITNGAVEALAEARWRVAFPPTFTALSPMLTLLPEDRVDTLSTTLDIPGGAPLTLDLHADVDLGADLPAIADKIASHVAEFTASTGPYPHGDRLTVLVWSEDRSMEYDGGITTSLGSLEHELFHSWYGRGSKPASQDDGWIDEGWDMYNTEPGFAFTLRPFDYGAPPTALDSGNPWSRATSRRSYARGGIIFAGLAAILGLDPLREHMRTFHAERPLGLYATEDLERHLYCATREPEVWTAIQRFVHGEPSPVLPAATYCE